MRSRTRLLRIGAALLLAALATPAFAGGWALVTLDAVPAPEAGAAISIGFMVRQHGITPIDENPFEGGALKPVLQATNAETGASITADARKEGPVGHFVVDVTFPSAGAWEVTITPPPFAGTQLEPLTVLPAAARAPAPQTNAAAGQPAATPLLSAGQRWALSGFVLIVALGATLLVLRTMRARGPLQSPPPLGSRQ